MKLRLSKVAAGMGQGHSDIDILTCILRIVNAVSAIILFRLHAHYSGRLSTGAYVPTIMYNPEIWTTNLPSWEFLFGGVY